MGRLVLLITVLGGAVASACAPGAEDPVAGTGDGGDPHAQLTCSTCHDQSLLTPARRSSGHIGDADAVVGLAPVPTESCSASRCHRDLGPREVEFRSVSFEHRRHGGDTVVAMGCTGCHAHDAGREPLTASLDPCSLCHLTEQSAGNTGECRQCHTMVEHVASTNRGLEVPHEGLPWLDGGCVRCHYDVTRAIVSVSPLQCRGCHEEEEEVVVRGIGEDLHDVHISVGCKSCHEGDAHRIRAMTSAVDLSCAECHRAAHAVAVTSEWPESATCNTCHGAVHLAEQEMVLGLIRDFPGAQPSSKFLAGLTCGSCHQEVLDADPATPVGAPAEGCQGCHATEYATVLDWWQDGSRTRIQRVEGALTRATRELDGPADALARLDTARALLDAVVTGRPEHNLPLSHRMLERASDLVTESYVLAGRATPRQPQLGRAPQEGLCSYCHYRADDPWVFEEMSGAFHREAMGLRR